MRQEIGFSPEGEAKFLERVASISRRVSLEQEIGTQIAEDFGIIEFLMEYELDGEGRIVDKVSGQGVLELTNRAGVSEETESIKKIEIGLKDNPDSIWIKFSPKNGRLNYPSNCVDFWRNLGEGRVVWNRIVVKNDFESMNRIRTSISGEEEVADEMEILRSPIKSDLKLSELFDLFRLNETKNSCNLELIESVVSEYTAEFESEFGESLTDDPNIIFRLYSACFKAIEESQYSGRLLERRYLDRYMFGRMNKVTEKKSYGCSVTTQVGEFGEKIGYYITANGEVKHGEIPSGYKECKKCGCWYKGNKCPFC